MHLNAEKFTLLELNPCLCGKHPTRSFDGRGYHIQCPRCSARTGYYLTFKEAANVWNRWNKKKKNGETDDKVRL